MPAKPPEDAGPGQGGETNKNRCPICGKPTNDGFAGPFCSERCRDVDPELLAVKIPMPFLPGGRTDEGEDAE